MIPEVNWGNSVVESLKLFSFFRLFFLHLGGVLKKNPGMKECMGNEFVTILHLKIPT